MSGLKIAKCLSAGLCALALIALIASPAAAADERLSIGTASTGGSWYPLGGGVANVINTYVKGYYASAHPSGASIENVRAVMKGHDALALSMPDAALYAYQGKDTFEGNPQTGLRGLFSTYPVDIQFYVLDSSAGKNHRRHQKGQSQGGLGRARQRHRKNGQVRPGGLRHFL